MKQSFVRVDHLEGSVYITFIQPAFVQVFKCVKSASLQWFVTESSRQL